MKNKYTTQQVWLFYEEEQKSYLSFQKDLAIIIANATGMAHPSESREVAQRKNKRWKDFIDSLTWNKIEDKSKKKVDPVKAFKNALRFTRK